MLTFLTSLNRVKGIKLRIYNRAIPHKTLCEAIHVSMVTNNMCLKANFGKIADFPDVIVSQLRKYPMMMFDESIIF